MLLMGLWVHGRHNMWPDWLVLVLALFGWLWRRAGFGQEGWVGEVAPGWVVLQVVVVPAWFPYPLLLPSALEAPSVPALGHLGLLLNPPVFEWIGCVECMLVGCGLGSIGGAVFVLHPLCRGRRNGVLGPMASQQCVHGRSPLQ